MKKKMKNMCNEKGGKRDINEKRVFVFSFLVGLPD